MVCKNKDLFLNNTKTFNEILLNCFEHRTGDKSCLDPNKGSNQSLFLVKEHE
jgi:hypothetical protein